MAKIENSETRIIKRSQIKLNPFNPKHHSEIQINRQKANFKKIGFLGGIVWNELTSNLIDGHRRVYALDIIYKYDGTPETDYDLKVEAIFLDEKAEKEQMTFMAVADTKVDFSIIAGYIHEIDAKSAGLTDVELVIIDDFLKVDEKHTVEELESVLSLTDNSQPEPEADYEERKAKIKEAKQRQGELSKETYQNGNSYIMLSFKSFENKLMFCEHFGLRSDENTISGEDFFNTIIDKK